MIEGADDRARDERQGNERDPARAKPAMGCQVTPDENNEPETREEDISGDDPRPHG